MNESKKKYLALLALNLTLFSLCLYLSKQVWILFLIFSIYCAFRLLKNPEPKVSVVPMPIDIVPGSLDKYYVDGPDEEPLYGLYLEIQGRLVFVDVKEDGLKQQRIGYAQKLSCSQAELDGSLARFMARNPAFAAREVGTIGLHSNETEQGEVFWDPEGYTLLKGTEFKDP